MHRLLVVDGYLKEPEPLQSIFELAGFEVEPAHHLRTALERIGSGEHAMVVLRLAEPGSDLAFVRAVRAHSQVPIVLVGRQVNDIDRILCLESGADEYLSQPFQPRELLARVRGIIRRISRNTAGATTEIAAGGNIGSQPERIAMGPLQLDSGTRAAYFGGNLLDLTNVEFNVLEILLRQSGRVVSREYLAQSVLGRAFRHYDRSIDMHVSRVRKKLGDPANGKGVIRTIRNVGYMLTKIPVLAPASGSGTNGTAETAAV